MSDSLHLRLSYFRSVFAFSFMLRQAGGPPLMIFACTITTEGAERWVAMLRILFDFVVDMRSSPLGAGTSDPSPSHPPMDIGKLEESWGQTGGKLGTDGTFPNFSMN